jgi:DNA-binding transcriptional regulator YiaG
MPNLAVVLKTEISRLARKEVRGNIEGLRRSSLQHQKTLADMKRRLAELERKIASLEKAMPRHIPSREATEQVAGAGRFSPRGLRSHRKRLKLSAEDYGKLIGVSGYTLYGWETKKRRPGQQQLAALRSLRHMGRKEALMRLEQLSQEGKKAK